MAIKKVFADLVNFLEANENSKVKTVMPQILDICSAKGGGGGVSNFIKDADGNVTHVYCYYHKKWEAVAECEYGAKANSPTGLNSMCKEGTSAWTKQQREAKNANQDLLTAVAKGEVAPGDIAAKQADIEANRAKIIPRADGKGSDEKPA